MKIWWSKKKNCVQLQATRPNCVEFVYVCVCGNFNHLSVCVCVFGVRT